MKAALVLCLLAASAFSQDQAALTAAETACGPKDVKFDASQDTTQHPTPQPEAGKALVYVIQDREQIPCPGCALTKVGLDGSWVGANQGVLHLFLRHPRRTPSLRQLAVAARISLPSLRHGQFHRGRGKNLLFPAAFHLRRLLLHPRPHQQRRRQVSGRLVCVQRLASQEVNYATLIQTNHSAALPSAPMAR